MFRAVKIRECPMGSFIKRKSLAKTIYIRGHYDKQSKTFSCIDAEDMNREIFLKGDTLVFEGFSY
jgi:hypothetical protein